MPFSSSLCGEQGGSAQHQKPGDDASYAQTAAVTESPGETPHCRWIKSGSVPHAASPVREVTRQPQFSFLMRSRCATLSGSQSAPRSARFFLLYAFVFQPSQRHWPLQKCAAPIKTHVFPLASDLCWKQTGRRGITGNWLSIT